MTQGILYIAKGDSYVREATMSARQVRSVMPECPITVVADRDITTECFDTVIKDESEYEPRDKPRLLKRSPYSRTIYIDTDIYVDDDISELFQVLNQFDCALVPDRADHHVNSIKRDSNNSVPDGFPEFNSGVIAFGSSPRTQEFLRQWEEACAPGHEFDQRSLRNALYWSSLRFTALPRRYNAMYHHSGHIFGRCKVFHGPLVQRADYHIDTAYAVQELNKSTDPRAFFGFKNRVVAQTAPSVFQQLLITLRVNGPITTAQKIVGTARTKLKETI